MDDGWLFIAYSKSYKYDGYDPEVPQGYICTSAARKMDIEWQAMRGKEEK